MNDATPYVIPTPSPQDVDGLVARPILQPDDRERLTMVRTVDVRTALARGLKEYLSSFEITWEGGRLLKFAHSFFVWAEPEDQDAYPSLAIVGYAPLQYDGAPMSPQTVAVVGQGGEVRYLRQVASAQQQFSVQVWATDPEERMGLTAMIEDALEPTDWMGGLRLELPYYFGARATYEKRQLEYTDSPADAQGGYRKAIFTVSADVPQYVPVGALRNMRPRLSAVVSG